MTDTETKTLAQKIAAIRGELGTIAKEGTNASQKYSYVKAEDVLREIRTKLNEHGIVIYPGARAIRHHTETGGKSFVSTVDLVYTLVDTETGEDRVCQWVGAGADIGGDKGLYKAYTGGLKYFLLNLFLIPTGDDPEADETVDRGATATPTRASVPEIPLDRAKAILDAAIAADLASMVDNAPALSSVLTAKLTELGVTTGRLGHLNVDQAESLEAWIKAEAEKASE